MVKPSNVDPEISIYIFSSTPPHLPLSYISLRKTRASDYKYVGHFSDPMKRSLMRLNPRDTPAWIHAKENGRNVNFSLLSSILFQEC